MLALTPRVSKEMPARLAAFSKSVDRDAHRLLGFGALRLDELRRDTAHDRTGNDRIVDKGYAQHVRAESLGHRNGEIARGIVIAQPEIDDDILDHDRFSSPSWRMHPKCKN